MSGSCLKTRSFASDSCRRRGAQLLSDDRSASPDPRSSASARRSGWVFRLSSLRPVRRFPASKSLSATTLEKLAETQPHLEVDVRVRDGEGCEYTTSIVRGRVTGGPDELPPGYTVASEPGTRPRPADYSPNTRSPAPEEAPNAPNLSPTAERSLVIKHDVSRSAHCTRDSLSRGQSAGAPAPRFRIRAIRRARVRAARSKPVHASQELPIRPEIDYLRHNGRVTGQAAWHAHGPRVELEHLANAKPLCRSRRRAQELPWGCCGCDVRGLVLVLQQFL